LSDRSGIFECMFDTLSQSAALTFWAWHDKQLPDGTGILLGHIPTNDGLSCRID